MKRLRVGVALAAATLALAPLPLLGLISLADAWRWPALLPGSLRFDRWPALLAGAGGLLGSLWSSLVVASAVGALSTAAGFFSARAVARHPRRELLLLLAYVPWAISPVVLGACLLFVYIRLGLAATLPGVILAHAIFAQAYAVIFWTSFWNAEKRAMEELVLTLGGGTWQFYRRVLLPLSKGPLAICFFQTFLISWVQYGLTLLVGAGKVQTLPLRVYAYVNAADPGYAAVASLLLLLPPVLLLWSRRRLAPGSLAAH